MALPTAQQAIVSAVPVLVIILSYAWFRQKRESVYSPDSSVKSSAGDQTSTNRITRCITLEDPAIIEAQVQETVDPLGGSGVGEEEPVFEMARKKSSVAEADVSSPEEKKSEVGSEEVKVMVEQVASLQIEPEPAEAPKTEVMEAVAVEEVSPSATAEAADAEVVQHLSTSAAAAQQQQQEGEVVVTSGEYDSANHSPADMMLASPSMSNYSDVNSEGSSDSGKGGSDIQTSSLDSELRTTTPPYTEPEVEAEETEECYTPMIYEFIFPQSLVGKLIGRHGSFVNQIKSKTQATILVKRHPETTKLKVVAVEGTRQEIEAALDMIRSKFPPKRFPGISLEAVNIAPPICPVNLSPESIRLVEGVSNDVMLTSVVSAGHFFLQQPTHPTYPNLGRLDACMNSCYLQSQAPELPRPVTAGVMCAAPLVERGWFRAEVIGYMPETDECDVRFVDYGGYMRLSASQLRQIRSDFINLPFQCCECFLAGVVPINESEGWSLEANTLFEELCQGQVLQAYVVGYALEGYPLLQLYSLDGSNSTCVNKELVDRGFAKLVESEQ